MCKLIANRHRNVALLALHGRTYIHLVVITAHGLETEKLTEEDLVSDWGELLAYTAENGLARFEQIAAELGATEGARKLLRRAASDLATA